MLSQYFVPVLLISLHCVTAQSSLADITLAVANIPEDGRLNFCELMKKYNYPCVTYKVTTEDGYILDISNVPGDKEKPVFLMHGFLDCSKTWAIKAHDSLAAWLHNNTYDLWFGNARGNLYSRNHTTLNPDGFKFWELSYWEFSFHETALYDLRAMIDFVLEKTGQTKLQVIGHSQGNQEFFALGASEPEYCSKIKIVICLAPIAFLHHAQQPIFPLLSLFGGPLLGTALGFIGHGELLRNSSELVALIRTVCTQGLVGYAACGVAVASLFFGADIEQLDPEILRVALGHAPSGTSMRNLVHIVQILKSKSFQQYDHGVGNLGKYGSLRPPKYDLSKVPFNVSLFVGLNDRLSAVKDVDLLAAELTHVVEYKIMPNPKWNHIDFVWGKDMRSDLFDPILESLKKYY